MDKIMVELKEKFEDIKNMGYVKSVSKDFGGVGKTLEFLLGLEQNYSAVSDYKGIELKAKCYNSKYDITLFSLTPNSTQNVNLPQYLINKYGYYLNDDRLSKVLYNFCFANRLSLGRNGYSFYIYINKECKKLNLIIFNNKQRVVQKDIFWSFENLQERLDSKMKYLAYIKAVAKYVDNQFYYKYESIDFFEMKSFDNFLNLLENADIYVAFNISHVKKGDNIGKVSYHGTKFLINEKDLLKMYNRLEV